MSETNLNFNYNGSDVDYYANSDGTRETIHLDDVCIADSSGQIGPWHDKAWVRTHLLHGAAKESAQNRLIKDYVISEVLAHIDSINAN